MRHRHSIKARIFSAVALGVLLFAAPTSAQDRAIPDGVAGYESHVRDFFANHCHRCHGPEQSKGGITVHSLAGDLSMGQELERWETILDVLEFGEMPPEDEPQPDDAERQAVASWIEAGLRDYVQQASQESPEPTTRRLTNVEYQNTLRDLLGFELLILDMLPEDPVQPYHFNNSAHFMHVGPEHLDRYLEVARHAMASAIVDPGEPEVHTQRREWEPIGGDREAARDEVSVTGGRPGSVATGMQLQSYPEHGEFLIRVQASVVLPEGQTQAPLRIVMGYPLFRTPGRLQVETVGTVHLSNSPDDPEVFEFRGRIENYPAKPSSRHTAGQPGADQMVITPQNLFDDGTLNDSGPLSNSLVRPRIVVNWIEFEGPLTEVWPPEHHTRILFDSPLRESDPAAYTREVISRFMTRAYRRPVAEEEVDRFAQIYRLVEGEFDTMEAAMRETLAYVLISPQFLYHTETHTQASHHYDLASKLSYFLWASMPDEQLLELAAQGRLDDPAVVEQQVLRMLDDERSEQFVNDFTRQWLSLDKSLTVPINQQLYPRFLYTVGGGERAGAEIDNRPTVREYMIAETVGFVGELIRRNASALQIVDSDFAYINQRLAAHYGIEGVHGEALRPVPIPDDAPIGGLLTQGSILIGNGTGTAPHPIYRAVFLREAILGDKVAPPPAEVPALTDTAGESAEQALTIAELLAQHRTVEACNDCHVRLDPWGIPFEHYNAIGQFQPNVPEEGTRVQGYSSRNFEDMASYQEYLESINTVEISAEARVPHGPNINGMDELKAFLLEERSEDIAENVIRRLMTYGLGRELTYRDRFVVEELMEQAQADDYRMRDIIVLICQSQPFLRSEEDADQE